MADYVMLGDVNTWYDEAGEGDPLVLLHPGGAGVDARALRSNFGALAQLMVVPGTSHGLLVEKPDLCNQVIAEFLASDPVTLMAPIRRAATS